MPRVLPSRERAGVLPASRCRRARSPTTSCERRRCRAARPTCRGQRQSAAFQRPRRCEGQNPHNPLLRINAADADIHMSDTVARVPRGWWSANTTLACNDRDRLATYRARRRSTPRTVGLASSGERRVTTASAWTCASTSGRRLIGEPTHDPTHGPSRGSRARRRWVAPGGSRTRSGHRRPRACARVLKLPRRASLTTPSRTYTHVAADHRTMTTTGATAGDSASQGVPGSRVPAGPPRRAIAPDQLVGGRFACGPDSRQLRNSRWRSHSGPPSK
jgi:hypothetical protein